MKDTKKKIEISTKFNVFSDTPVGKDPDSDSPTLKQYHKFLWSKPLPNGDKSELCDNKECNYLLCITKQGEFCVGSDAITNSYGSRRVLRDKLEQENKLDDLSELFTKGCTIGAYIIFPNKQIDNQHTINQARGSRSLIRDRFDLTLECIRRFYKGEANELNDVLLRYKSFFDLFETFEGYVEFFLLQDLVNKDGNIKFFLPFSNFKTDPIIESVEKYLKYKENVINFIDRRNKRIEKYARGLR